MATTATITPTLGAAPVTLQAGNYSAIDDRRAWGYLTTESVSNADAYKVIQRAAGANMTVDVQSSNGEAVVTGDSVTAQGNYTVPRTASNVNVDIAAADATNPRNDLVVLEVKDDQHDAGGLNLARVRVITGTANASAALTDNPGSNGTPALPSSCQLLAVVRVAAAATTVTTAAISDRRRVASVGAWAAWTPTITQTGNVTFTDNFSRYTQIGRIVTATTFMTITGTGTGNSAIEVSLPVAAYVAGAAAAQGFIYDASIPTMYLVAGFVKSGALSTLRFFADNVAGNEFGINPNMGLAANDQIRFTAVYEAGS